MAPSASLRHHLSPIPFPKGLRTIDLPRISLNKLLENDDAEIDKIYNICVSTGFFYLNLQDHPDGQRLWKEACDVCKVGMDVLPNLPMETKLAYKSRDRAGVFDMGYKCHNINNASGESKFSKACEGFSVPLYEMLVDTGFQLPPWLTRHESLFAHILIHGNEICRVLLGALERKLQVPPGAISSLHQVADPSNDFLRVLRYPGTDMKPGEWDDDPDMAKFPPHRDWDSASVSVAMLFTWVGGLQILDPAYKEVSSVSEGSGAAGDDGWRWVEPVPGHVIVNLGDALAILTNRLFKSGFHHRVVGAPGDQASLERYSVLLGYRPALETVMRPLESPVIPHLTEEQAAEPALTCEEWGAVCVQKVVSGLGELKDLR